VAVPRVVVDVEGAQVERQVCGAVRPVDDRPDPSLSGASRKPSTGSVTAVRDVCWLRKSARVRGRTSAQTVSTISSALATGRRTGVRT
jgi:hypothetical protein